MILSTRIIHPSIKLTAELDGRIQGSRAVYSSFPYHFPPAPPQLILIYTELLQWTIGLVV